MNRRAFTLGIWAAAVAAMGADTVPILKFTVDPGKHARRDTPVAVELPFAIPRDNVQRRLVETTDGKTVPLAYVFDGDDRKRLLWILSGVTEAGKVRTFRLEPGAPQSGGGFSIDGGDRRIEVRAKGGSPVLWYNNGHVAPPPGLDPKLGRSAHLHPVRTPSGLVVTDQFPPDHPHQSGIFLAYTKTEFEGRTPNFWDLHNGGGFVRFKTLRSLAATHVCTRIVAEHEHVDRTAPEGEKVALNETWDVRLWDVGGKEAGWWLFDIASTIRCATKSPLKLPKYHYGGMALRGAREWTKEAGRFRTSDGKGRDDGNHTRPRWCDLSGPIGKATAGIALLTHPTNFRFPEPVRLHPTMPYFVYTPSHLGDWEIVPGKEHVSRYRFVVHDGELKVEVADRLWHDFAEPPVVRIEP